MGVVRYKEPVIEIYEERGVVVWRKGARRHKQEMKALKMENKAYKFWKWAKGLTV